MSSHKQVAKTMNVIMAELGDRYFERTDLIEAMTLAVLAREHAFILGPPGTAKSEITRDLLGRITDSEYFEILLSKTRPDAALLGPLDLVALRTTGDYVRRDAGYLPTCHFAMLDEIGKMGATLGHDLLAALNERRLHQVANGQSYKDIPLMSAITASNEVPTGESEDAAALYDRLLVRVNVEYIAEARHFAQLLTMGLTPGVPTTLALADLVEAVDIEVPAIVVPVEVIDAVLVLRQELRTVGIRPSDRRWRASMKVIKARAYLSGHDTATLDDLSALRFTLWDTAEQIRTVERAVLKLANPLNEEAMVIVDALTEIKGELAMRRGKSVAERAGYGSEALAKMATLKRQVTALGKKAVQGGHSLDKINEVKAEVTATRRQVLIECLDTDPTELDDM